jgi:hypothetical protein
MTLEQPRMMFLHYWGIERASDLAQAVKGALAKTPADGPGGAAVRRAIA